MSFHRLEKTAKRYFYILYIKKIVLWFTVICLNLLLCDLPLFAESTSDTLPHACDFLTLPNGPGGTTWYPKASSTDRATARQELKNRGYKHLYLSVVSEDHNYYGNPAGFRVFLQELNNDGIKPVVWLTSDTGAWKDQTVSAINSALTTFIPQIDDLVNSYCVGIEIDEYWSEAEADEIGNHLDSLTDKPIAVHQLPNAWGYCNGYCDYLIFQYGFGKTESQIISMTTNVKNSLGKPVVAGEYNLDRNNEALSIRLGDAALSAGASGFGNGGTADTTPPSTPAAVNDGTGADIDSTSLTNQLSANWTASTDSQSPSVSYKYAIGTSPGGTNVAGWTANSGTSVTKAGTFTVGQTYYFSVKAVSAGGESAARNSDGQVVTAAVSGITVTSPNGGENWTVGTAHSVTWTSQGTVGNVNIDYSINGGTSWTTLVSNTANDGTQSITVPNTPGTSCRIRVIDVDGSPSDASNANFIISAVTPAITVTSPDGGENWIAGAAKSVTWTSQGTVGNVNIDCSINGGTSWTTLVSNTANDSTQSIIVPNTPGTSCRIRVIDVDGSPSDTSNANFTIALVNQAPVASNDSKETLVNQPVYIQLGYSDPDGPGPYTITITQALGHGTLTGSGNDRTYTPTAGFTGIDSFKWRVNDSELDSNESTVTLYVVAVDTADTTPPSIVAQVRDGNDMGADTSVTYLTDELSANWDNSADVESGISRYYFAIGSLPGATNIINWKDNGLLTEVTETGLTLAIGVTYYFSVKAENGVELQSAVANSDGQLVLSMDSQGPLISNVSAQGITHAGATITWETDEPSTSRVEYGLTASYGSLTGEYIGMNTEHSVTLTGLLSGTQYHFRVISRDYAGNESTSVDYTFTTLSTLNTQPSSVYPNPHDFAGGAPMRFKVSATDAGEVKIYTMTGKLVRNMTAQSGANEISWDGTNEDGKKVARGIYLYTITQGSDKITGKLAVTGQKVNQ